MSFAVNSEYNAATVDSFRVAGFSEALVTNSFYNVLFTDAGSKQVETLNSNRFQKVNQFPLANQFNNKTNLLCNIKNLIYLHGQAYNFIPESYILSKDRKAFEMARAT